MGDWSIKLTVFAPAFTLDPEHRFQVFFVAGTVLVFLMLQGGLAALTIGAGVMVGIFRVMFWGALRWD